MHVKAPVKPWSKPSLHLNRWSRKQRQKMISLGIHKALPPEALESLIALHAPVLYLHHDEKYFPTNVEWFLARSQLVHAKLGVLLEKGHVTQAVLLEQQSKHGHEHLYLDIAPADYSGANPADGALDDIPLYAHAKIICNEHDGHVEAIEIVYMTFYAYNGEYPLMGFTAFKAGHHVGDWEHLTVRLEAPAWDLHGVWYNSHRNIEGEWCASDDVPRDPVTHRIAAYVARAGHGVYPRVGRVLRLFCIANDFTSKHGLVWRPNHVVRMCTVHGRTPPCVISRGCCLPPLPFGPPTHTVFPTQLPSVVDDASLWQLYKGDWGTSPSPSMQCWFSRPEPPVSRTHFERLVLVWARGVERLPSLARAAAVAITTAGSHMLHHHHQQRQEQHEEQQEQPHPKQQQRIIGGAGVQGHEQDFKGEQGVESRAQGHSQALQVEQQAQMRQQGYGHGRGNVRQTARHAQADAEVDILRELQCRVM